MERDSKQANKQKNYCKIGKRVNKVKLYKTSGRKDGLGKPRKDDQDRLFSEKVTFDIGNGE